MDREGWLHLIQSAAPEFPRVGALTYRGRWESDSKPVWLACDDGDDYVIKGRRADAPAAHYERVLVNDNVIAQLGGVIDAPVGDVVLVDVPKDLIDLEPMMSHLMPGLSHGTRFLAGCGDRQGVVHCDVTENRRRFARLAVLYGWIHAQDRQVIYENAPPHLVHSLDHGHFFPGGPMWTSASLTGALAPSPDVFFVAGCSLSPDELQEPLNSLSGVSDEAIASVVAVPPDLWSITMDERVALAEYLGGRRDALVGAL